MSMQQALQRALEGSGLALLATSDNAYQVRRATAQTMRAVRVTAAEEGSPFGPAEADRRTSKGGALFGDVDLREIPFSINVIDEAEITRRRSRTLTDILETDPAHSVGGWFANGVNSLSSFGMIRGFVANRAFTDGTPLMDNDLGQVEMLERVEVLRGPAAFRYGFVPPGGIINQVTKQAADDPFAALHVSYDNWGMLYGHADFSGRLGENDALGYRANLASNQGEVFAGDGVEQRYLIGLTTDYRVSDRTLVTLTLSNSNSHADEPTWGQAIADENGDLLPFGPEDDTVPAWAYNEYSMTRAVLRVDSALTDTVDLTMAFGANRADWNYVDFWMEHLQPNGDGDATTRKADEHNYSFSNTGYVTTDFVTGSVQHQLTAGYLIERTSITWEATYGVPQPYNIIDQQPLAYPDPDFRIGYKVNGEQYGAFVSDQLEMGQGWHGVIGLRYSRIVSTDIDHLNDTKSPSLTTTAVSPMIGVLYDVAADLGVYASVGTGVEPGLRAPEDASNPREQLGARDSTQYEIGMKWTFAEGRALLDASLFQISQSSQYYTGPGTRFDDYGEQRHTGAELLVRGRLWKPLLLSGGVQYLDAELIDSEISDAEGDRPVGVPEWQAVLDARFDIEQLPGLWVGGTVLHVGSRELSAPNDDIENDAYTRYDLGIGYTFATAATTWDVGMRVENVTDIEYFVGSWRNWGAPRTYSFGFDIGF